MLCSMSSLSLLSCCLPGVYHHSSYTGTFFNLNPHALQCAALLSSALLAPLLPSPQLFPAPCFAILFTKSPSLADPSISLFPCHIFSSLIFSFSYLCRSCFTVVCLCLLLLTLRQRVRLLFCCGAYSMVCLLFIQPTSMPAMQS